MSKFVDLKLKARRHAQVDSEVVTQSDGGDEEEHCREALRQYSQVRPYVDAVLVPKLTVGADPVWTLSDLVDGWTEDSHQVTELYIRDGGERTRFPSNSWAVVRESGVSKLQLDSDPGREFWMRYSAQHDPTADPFLFPAQDLDAIAHLAAALILEQAANHHGRQYNQTMDADGSNTQQQSVNYAMRARDQRKLYQEYLDRRPAVAGGFKRANWSSGGVDGKDSFWTNRYA